MSGPDIVPYLPSDARAMYDVIRPRFRGNVSLALRSGHARLFSPERVVKGPWVDFKSEYPGDLQFEYTTNVRDYPHFVPLAETMVEVFKAGVENYWESRWEFFHGHLALLEDLVPAVSLATLPERRAELTSVIPKLASLMGRDEQVEFGLAFVLAMEGESVKLAAFLAYARGDKT